MQSIRRLLALAMLTLAATQPAEAAMGLSQIEATAEDGPITLYYPTGSPSRTVMRGPFALQVAEQAPPARGNGRLVVVSHGSGGSPWVHHDLARQLVEAGFVVALPQHRGDNYLDFSAPGPDS
jgi:predicted dienelactone hydrolase